MVEVDDETKDARPRVLDAYKSTLDAERDGEPLRGIVRAALFEEREPTRLGRYAVLRVLGQGGMGRVYAAYDDELDRRVAIKVLRRDVDEESLARVRNEARAMAKLSHPHVVQVYEVGEAAGETYIAMEYIKGETLARWQQAADRSWREVVGVYRQAGEALAAAHGEGLVHRDFKPQNAMVQVGAKGRPRLRVLDFGLARATERLNSLDESIALPVLDESAGLAEDLTATGSLLGTPAYMAPEQFNGEDVDPRADQFSFCVALWEALYGERPFAGANMAELCAAVTQGERRPPPTGRVVPAWLRQAVERGLSVAPSNRWPTMDALLEALSYDPARRRNRWLRVGAGVAFVGLVGVTVQQWLAARAERCAGATGQLGDAWDSTRRDQVRDAIRGIDRSYAEAVWSRSERVLDEYAQAWKEMYTEACEATTIRREQSAEVMDLRIACLYRAKLDLSAATRVLADADADVVAKAHRVLDTLRPLSRCADVEALRADIEPPLPGEAEAVEAARARLAQALALRKAGRYDAAAIEVDAARDDLAAIEYGPVRTELAVEEGRLHEARGAYDDSEASARQAVYLAARWNQRDSMSKAANLLMAVVGIRQKRFEESLQHRALVEGLAAGDPHAESVALGNLALVHNARGELEEAEELQERALAMSEKALGTDHPTVAAILNNLAVVHDSKGDYAEAVRLYERALAIRQSSLGPEHPAVAASLTGLAAVRGANGDYAAAVELLERAIDIQTNALGANHLSVALTLNNLANLHNTTGAYAKAEKLYRQALAVRERALGSDHPDVAATMFNLAGLHKTMGADEEATRLFERALAIFEGSLGPDHPLVATSLNGLATMRHARGEYEEAEKLHERALAIREKALGPDHPDVAMSLGNLASLHYSMGGLEKAETLHTRALAIREKAQGPDHPDVAVNLNSLANLQLEKGAHAEAARLHERALAIWEKAMGPDHRDVALSVHNLARVRKAQGKLADAEKLFARALTIREKALGSDHPVVARSLIGLAEVAIARGRAADAVAPAERAIEIREAHDVAPAELARARFVLARALTEAKQDRPRAVALARQAQEGYREAGAGSADALAEVEAWLR